MENRVRFPIMVLRIEIRPEESSESLEKLLLKIHGVHEVAINREKQKVTILGDVNPLKLVKYIAKMGKRAELLVYDKKPKIDAPNPDHNTNKHGNSTQYGHADHHPHCNAANDSFHRHYKYASSVKDADRREQHSAHNNDKYRGKKKVEEEEEDQEFFHSVHPPNDHQYFHGRTRNPDYEYAHEPANFQFHEAKFEQEIKEAKRDMNRFFSGAAGSSAHHHHHQMPRPNYSHWTRDHQHYGDRNHPRPPPPPPPPRRVYSARPGTHYDKFTNFFSDENPSSCTII